MKLSRTDFYSAKFLNNNKIFAKNCDYLFVAQQHLERHLLESNINVAGQKGLIRKKQDGSQIVSCKNSFDIFSKVPGTPQYWRVFRNELFARMEQLGQFHFFFTLSSAEMKWPEVTISILHYEFSIDKVIYQQGWEENEDNIEIYFKGWENDRSKIESLKKFKDTQKDKHKFYKDHFLLITRLFDNRVKAFINNILIANEDVEHFSYRIEFQVRGLPHLHGVFWLNEEKIQNYKEGGQFHDAKVIQLIDKYISCSINTKDQDLNKLVKEVNVHKHTKSCRKGNKICRFSFPRLPSDETLIAKPLSEDLIGKKRYQEKLNDAKSILDKVSKKLAEMSDEDLANSSLKDILEHPDVNITKQDYHDALAISTKGSMVILKRRPNEMWVNNYNPIFLKAWQANMDIQFCMDSYAIITYITDYLTKGDAGLTRELTKVIYSRLANIRD